MSCFITQILRDSGTPRSGLSATITIYDLDTNKAVISNKSMEEVGTSGIYKYNFAEYSVQKQYAWILDGSSALAAADERYPAGIIKRDDQYFNIRDLLRKFPNKIQGNRQ